MMSMYDSAPNLKVVAQVLQTTPAVLATMLADLDDALLSWRPAPGEWCIKEVVGHLLEMDKLAFADRIRLILAEDEPTIPGVNVNKIAAERRDNERPLSELLAAFVRERETAVSFLNQLPADQLHRTGTFPTNRHFRASDFLYEWPYHDHDHIKQISDIIRAAFWPHLSETMQRALS